MKEDLEPGGILYEQDHITAERAWEFYKNLPEFIQGKVVFSQFKARLADHRNQAKKFNELAERDAMYVANDRIIHEKPTLNCKGELQFNSHPAKDLLREDVGNDLHVGVAPSVLQASRPEYMEFSLKVFDQRLRQELRRKKYINYLRADRLKY